MPSANAHWYKLGEALLVLSQGDITTWSGDALVNAANERMLGGGGVDGAIHRAAGPKLMDACKQIPEVEPGVRCPTGQARITRGGRLQAKYVIHTVGPEYEDDETSAPLLAAAYKSCLELATKQKLENIAFPAISTGVYGYPVKEAAEVSLTTIKDHVGTSLKYVEFVLHPEEIFKTFVEVADTVLEPIPNAGGAAVSEPVQVLHQIQPGHSASLHPSSQAAQPTASGSQSESVCGKAGEAGELEVTSAAATRAPTPSGTAGPSGTTPSEPGPSLAAPASTFSGGPIGSCVPGTRAH